MPDQHHTLALVVLPEQLSVCQLSPAEDVPHWAHAGSFTSITRTADELSIICPSPAAPAGVRRSDGWRALQAAGQFDFSVCGVLSSIAGPLAQAGISILALCTFNTDYVLVRDGDLDRALQVLEAAGHRIE